MNYTISTSTLYGYIDVEVSKVADAAYNEQGESLYDSIVLTDKDEDIVEGFIDDAAARLVRATEDIATPAAGTITFNVPDMPAALETPAATEIDHYITWFAVAGILQSRRPSEAPQYAERAAAALENAIALLRKRTAPSRTTTEPNEP